MPRTHPDNLPRGVKLIPAGSVYGSWTVLSFSHIQNKKAHWLCRCACGSEKPVAARRLKAGLSKQCQSCSAKKTFPNNLRYKKEAPHLYVVVCEEYMKVGTTGDIKSRLSSLRMSNPFDVELIQLREDQGHLEQSLHEALNEWHVKGEWFKCTFESLTLVEEICDADTSSRLTKP